VSYLVDTNVLSELRRPQPAASVVAWFSERPAASLYLSVLTLGEIRKGVAQVQDVARRQRLSDWLELELPAWFMGRVLPIDAAVADCWGQLQTAAVKPLPAIDSLLAATAIQHGLVLVTRNQKDFAGLPLEVFNPWD